jgi:hypothetical protein
MVSQAHILLFFRPLARADRTFTDGVSDRRRTGGIPYLDCNRTDSLSASYRRSCRCAWPPNPLYPLIAERAALRCEYCHAPEVAFNVLFEVEHTAP